MTPEEKNKQDEYLKNFRRQITEIYAKVNKEVPKKVLDIDSIEEAGRELEDVRVKLGLLDDTASGVYESMKAIVGELGSSRSATAKATSTLRKQLDISQKLKFNEQGITTLSKAELKNLQNKYKIQQAIGEENAEEIASKIGIDKELDRRLKAEEDIAGFIQQQDITDDQKAILSAYYDRKSAVKQVNDQLEKAIEFEEKIASATGLTGAAFENLNRIGIRAFGGLGVNLSTLSRGFEDANAAMRSQAAEDMNKSMGNLRKRFRTVRAAVRELGPSLSDTFTDPVIFAGGLADMLFKMDEALIDFSRTTGLSADVTSTFNSEVGTAIEQMALISELTKEYGINAGIAFSGETIGAVTDLQVKMALTAQEARGLTDAVAATNVSAKEVPDAIFRQVSAFNAANSTAINQRTIMGDVLSTSEGIRASLGGSTRELTAAATSARRLGMSLEEVDAIAESLLDFESSIQNELEAQLLTGRNINLFRARELALVNDINGLSEELFSNTVSIAEFASMNRIQQNSIAQALGISRKELGKIAYLRAIEEGLTSEAAANAANISAEDAQRISIQENFQRALQKTLEILNPVLESVANILSMPFVGKGLITGLLALQGAKGLVGFLRNTKDFLTGIAGTAVKAATKTKEFLNKTTDAGKAAGDAAIKFNEKANRYYSTATGKFVKAPKEAAAAAKKTIDSTTDSVKKLGTAQKAAIGGKGRQPGGGIRMFLVNVARGLNALAGASASIPVLLSIAAVIASVGVAFAGMGFGIKKAAEGIVLLLDKITPANLLNLAKLTGHIKQLARSMALLGTVGLLGIPALAAISSLAVPAMTAGKVVGGKVGIQSGVSNTSTTQQIGSNVNNSAAPTSMTAVENKLDELIKITKEGKIISIDGYQLNRELSLQPG